MSHGDKYARARALSKIFEDLLQRNKGDAAAAAGEMDEKVGPEWREEIVIPDEQGPEFIDVAILEMPPKAPCKGLDKTDKMLQNARELAMDFSILPDDDLRMDPASEAVQKEPKADKESNKKLADMLRKMADDLEGDND